MPKPKLYYFATRGAGEITRLLLAYGDVDYDNIRVGFDTWNEIKPTTPFGQLPVLEWEGVMVAQSHAIARFVAKKVGLSGKDDFEQFQADAVAELVRDFQTEYFKTLYADDKKAAGAKLVAEAAPKFLDNAEKYLKEHGGQYFVGNHLTWADLAMMEMLSDFTDPTEPRTMLFQHLDDSRVTILKKYPLLEAHLTRIKAVPAVKKWHETRPSNAEELEGLKKMYAARQAQQQGK